MIEPGKHQIQAVEKFVGLPYCFIGDSMGVGKTLTGVLLDFEERKRAKKDHYRTLIICTKGGLSVWKNHLVGQGVDPERIIVIDPGDRSAFDAEVDRGAVNYDYYVVHWNALALLPSFNKLSIGRNALVWDHIIADEAHYAKNRKAERTIVLKKLKAVKRTAVSGTPADDKPQDIWSVWNWLDKKTYSSYWRFFNTYIDYTNEVNHRTGGGYRKVNGVKNMEDYHRKVAPYYIRRTLYDVRDDMPPKTFGELWVDLSPRQMKDYQQLKTYQTAILGRYDQEYTLEWQIAMWARLQMMTLGTVDEVDWSEFERFWDKWRDADPDDIPKNVPTGPKFVLGEPSPKLDVVMEKIEEAREENESIVIMTNYREVVRLLEARCKGAKIPTSILHGGITSQARRDAAVADFQSRKKPVFVGTIGAAGTSITLTAAHTIMFTDRHWNPSVNRQATDRIWRFDQQFPCQVWDVSARNTIDREKRQRIEEKGQRVDAIVEQPLEYR